MRFGLFEGVVHKKDDDYRGTQREEGENSWNVGRIIKQVVIAGAILAFIARIRGSGGQQHIGDIVKAQEKSVRNVDLILSISSRIGENPRTVQGGRKIEVDPLLKKVPGNGRD